MILHGFPTFDLAYLLIHDGGQGGHAWGKFKKEDAQRRDQQSTLLFAQRYLHSVWFFI
jgi:hypothetical protein